MLSHLAPEGYLSLLFLIDRFESTQSAVSLAAIRFPLYTDGICLSFLQFEVKLASVRIPCCAPYLLIIVAFACHILSVSRQSADVYLLIARVIVAELIYSRLVRSNSSLIDYSSFLQRKRRKILGRLEVFEIDAVLTAH